MASSDGDSNFTNVVASGTLAVTGAATFADDLTVTGTLTGTLVPPQVVDADGDGAITIQTSIVFITKGSAAALTLAAPTVDDDDGVTIWIIATTAAAHTVTATTIGFNALNTDGDLGTFGGAVGDGIGVMAFQGEWYVIPGSNLNVTLS